MAAWPHGDPDVVVRDILAGRAYAHAAVPARATAGSDPPADNSVATIIDRTVQHVIVPLFHPLARAAQAAHGVGSLIGVLLIVFALGLLAVALYRLALAFGRPGRAAAAQRARATLGLEGTLDSVTWRARADAAARAGDFGRAVAALFAAALTMLDERALVAFDPSRTPGEYRRLVRRIRSGAAPPFDDLAASFTRAAYAEVPATQADFVAAKQAYAIFEPATA